MKISLKSKIINKLQEAGTLWVPSYDLEKVDTRWGWIGSSGSRRARELAAEGKIEHKVEGKYAYYRSKQIQQVQQIQVLKPQKPTEQTIKMAI